MFLKLKLLFLKKIKTSSKMLILYLCFLKNIFILIGWRNAFQVLCFSLCQNGGSPSSLKGTSVTEHLLELPVLRLHLRPTESKIQGAEPSKLFEQVQVILLVLKHKNSCSRAVMFIVASMHLLQQNTRPASECLHSAKELERIVCLVLP